MESKKVSRTSAHRHFSCPIAYILFVAHLFLVGSAAGLEKEFRTFITKNDSLDQYNKTSALYYAIIKNKKEIVDHLFQYFSEEDLIAGRSHAFSATINHAMQADPAICKLVIQRAITQSPNITNLNTGSYDMIRYSSIRKDCDNFADIILYDRDKATLNYLKNLIAILTDNEIKVCKDKGGNTLSFQDSDFEKIFEAFAYYGKNVKDQTQPRDQAVIELWNTLLTNYEESVKQQPAVKDHPFFKSTVEQRSAAYYFVKACVVHTSYTPLITYIKKNQDKERLQKILEIYLYEASSSQSPADIPANIIAAIQEKTSFYQEILITLTNYLKNKPTHDTTALWRALIDQYLTTNLKPDDNLFFKKLETIHGAPQPLTKLMETARDNSWCKDVVEYYFQKENIYAPDAAFNMILYYARLYDDQKEADKNTSPMWELIYKKIPATSYQTRITQLTDHLTNKPTHDTTALWKALIDKYLTTNPTHDNNLFLKQLSIGLVQIQPLTKLMDKAQVNPWCNGVLTYYAQQEKNQDSLMKFFQLWTNYLDTYKQYTNTDCGIAIVQNLQNPSDKAAHDTMHANYGKIIANIASFLRKYAPTSQWGQKPAAYDMSKFLNEFIDKYVGFLNKDEINNLFTTNSNKNFLYEIAKVYSFRKNDSPWALETLKHYFNRPDLKAKDDKLVTFISEMALDKPELIDLCSSILDKIPSAKVDTYKKFIDQLITVSDPKEDKDVSKLWMKLMVKLENNKTWFTTNTNTNDSTLWKIIEKEKSNDKLLLIQYAKFNDRNKKIIKFYYYVHYKTQNISIPADSTGGLGYLQSFIKAVPLTDAETQEFEKFYNSSKPK